MLNIVTGPNGIFLRLDTLTVRCGDFTRDLAVARLGGQLLNRHGEVLQLNAAQCEWLTRQAEKQTAFVLDLLAE